MPATAPIPKKSGAREHSDTRQRHMSDRQLMVQITQLRARPLTEMPVDAWTHAGQDRHDRSHRAVQQQMNLLLGEILELLRVSENRIERYAEIHGKSARTSTKEHADSAEAIDWILTSLQDISATVDAISRHAPPENGSLDEEYPRCPFDSRRELRADP